MYLDLISAGMKKELAQLFYEEVRCLSRANINPSPQQNAWEVCFSYDYSELVGNLLAGYVLKDSELFEPLIDPSTRTAVNSTSRFFSASAAVNQKRSFLMTLFGDGQDFRLFGSKREQLMQKSCCQTCTSGRYFVNVQRNECLRNPFGKHCCHVACKSLGRLKVGVSSSVSYCCPRCRPQPCET